MKAESGPEVDATRAHEFLGYSTEHAGSVTRYIPRHGAPLPFIDLGIGYEYEGSGVRLTPDEAEHLAGELLRLVKEIRGAA